MDCGIYDEGFLSLSNLKTIFSQCAVDVAERERRVERVDAALSGANFGRGASRRSDALSAALVDDYRRRQEQADADAGDDDGGAEGHTAAVATAATTPAPGPPVATLGNWHELEWAKPGAADKCKFVVHFNFGNEELHSTARVVVEAPRVFDRILAWFADELPDRHVVSVRSLKNDFPTVFSKDISPETIARVLALLHKASFLSH